MALTVTVASTDDVYTTTAYVKALLGTTATSNDATLNTLIKAASRWADNYVGYPLALCKVRESVPSFDSRVLMLDRTPIVAVPALYDATSTDDATQLLSSEFRVENRDAGFLSRDVGFVWTVPVQQELSLRPRPGQEYKPWLIDYTAGYTYGGIDTGSANWSTVQGTTSTGRTLPEDIEHAVALKAVSMFTGFDSVRGNIKTAVVGDIEVERAGRQAGGVGLVDPPEATILQSYMRIK